MAQVSQGIFIKGLPIINVNGTYSLVDNNTSGIARVWVSNDVSASKVPLYGMKYIQDTNPAFLYSITEDLTFVQGKTYYAYNSNTKTYYEYSSALSGGYIPADSIYERVPNSYWAIAEITAKHATGEFEWGEVLYKFITDNEALNPYDNVAVWEDAEGNTTSAVLEYWDASSFVTEVSEPVVDEEAGTVTTVTTTTNMVTGAVYKETSVVRTKTVYESKELIRYDPINLALNKVYRFKFISDFKPLGYQTEADGTPVEGQPENAGIYRVDKILSYRDLVLGGIDLYANLYQPLGIAKEVYEKDVKERLSGASIYRLIDPTDKSRVFYMPQPFLDDTPDPSVDVYYKTQVVLDLGIIRDPEMLEDIENILTETIEKMYGIKPAEGEKLVTLNTTTSVWLTESQMKELEELREQIKKDSKVDLVSLYSLTTTNEIYVENRRLKGRVASLEELLTQLKLKLYSTQNTSEGI